MDRETAESYVKTYRGVPDRFIDPDRLDDYHIAKKIVGGKIPPNRPLDSENFPCAEEDLEEGELEKNLKEQGLEASLELEEVEKTNTSYMKMLQRLELEKEWNAAAILAEEAGLKKRAELYRTIGNLYPS